MILSTWYKSLSKRTFCNGFFVQRNSDFVNSTFEYGERYFQHINFIFCKS